MKDTVVIELNVDVPCSSCGKKGAIKGSGLCMPCATKRLERNNMSAGIKFEAISVAMRDLEDAFTRKQNAAEDYKTLVQSTADAAGIDAAVVRAYVAARMNDRADKASKQAEQLNLCFETLGA